MENSIIELVLYALGGCILGAVSGWLVHAKAVNRRFSAADDLTLAKIHDVTDQRNRIASESSRARETIQNLQNDVAQRNLELGKRASEITRRDIELASVVEKYELMAKNVLTLRTERENTKIQVKTVLEALESLKAQTATLQIEFDNTREFYKRELHKSFEKRKLLEKEFETPEIDMKESQAKLKAIAKREKSAPKEPVHTDTAVAEAKLRLVQIEMLEQKVTKFKSENTDLYNDISRLKQELESQEQDLAELAELRINNKQLVRCLEGLEGSRKAHETDAERYREKADESEKVSDTLRYRLEDMQKHFAEIEEQQDQALTNARKASVVPLRKSQG